MSPVYFARAGGYVKIGFASNPWHRIKGLGTSSIIYPEGLDRATPLELVLVIPFCRHRDERNLHMLFARHWAEGEWFHWTPEFRYQMETMQFVTHETRLKHLRAARRAMGVVAEGVKEERWGKSAAERLAGLQDAS